MNAASEPQAAPTILVVDDEDALRDLVAEVITDEGYNVLKASNGREALEVFKAHQNQIKLVLLDMMMPEMDGRKTYHLLRESSKDVKILIASGFTNDEQVKGLLAQGANGVVDKPFHIDRLAEKIRTALAS